MSHTGGLSTGFLRHAAKNLSFEFIKPLDHNRFKKTSVEDNL
jgi:hypothetical protein